MGVRRIAWARVTAARLVPEQDRMQVQTTATLCQGAPSFQVTKVLFRTGVRRLHAAHTTAVLPGYAVRLCAAAGAHVSGRDALIRSRP